MTKTPNFIGQGSCNYLMTLSLKNITTIIKNQLKMSDQIYQNAIEANYSHEQMTPLNLILSTTSVLMKKIRKSSHEMCKQLRSHQLLPFKDANQLYLELLNNME